jgi:hypothetical protein
LISTAQNPTSFADFNDSSGKAQFARDTANATGTGVFCIPLDLSSTGISGVADGANVTIQIVYNDDLYQVGLLAAFPSPNIAHRLKV